MLRRVFSMAVCAAMAATSLAGAMAFPARPVAEGEVESATSYGAAPGQLTRDGRHDASQSALTFDPIYSIERNVVAEDGTANQGFGEAVAVSGDIMVVGLRTDDLGENEDQGSAYVYSRNGSVWSFEQKLTASDGETNDFFGLSVAIDNGTVVVGAPRDVIGENEGQGSAYIFFRPPCPTFVFWPHFLLNGTIGAYYEQAISVGHSEGPHQFSIVGGALPPGLSLSPSGLLSGKPEALGTYQFTIGATDPSIGCSGSRAYTLTINPCPWILIEPFNIPNGNIGALYNHSMTAIGGKPPYEFIVKSGLPPGLSISADGIISGTPTQAGYFPFTMFVRDANGCSSGHECSITIDDIPISISVEPRRKGGSR